ncbi:MAG: PAS domain-containing protein [Janthinobacterium lividum]
MTAAVPLADLFTPEDWFALLDVSLTGIHLVRPVYELDGTGIVDFAIEYLNPAGQRMTGLAEQPGGTLLGRFPHALAAGIFAYYRRVFETGEQLTYQANYQADGLDNFFQFSARRSGAHLLVSFTNTSTEDRSAVEETLRESQAAERAARAEAEQQRQRFWEVLTQMPAYIAVYQGPDHVYQFVNPAYQSLFPHRSFLGRPFREGTPESVELGVVALFDQVYQTGEPVYLREMEGWFDFHGTGQPVQVFLNISLHPLRNVQGQIDGVLDFTYDVSEQVRARQQLQQLNQELENRVQARTVELQAARTESEAQRVRLEQVFQNAPAAIAVYDGPELVFELVNPVYQALLPGRSLLGKSVRQAFPEVAELPIYQTLRQVYETGRTHEEYDQHIAVVGSDGQLQNRYFNFTLQARYTAHGHINGVIGFGFETTEQVLARQQTEAAQERLRLVTDALPVLIGYLDRERRYQFTNRAYEAWFNQPADALLGRKVREVVGEAAYQATASYMDRVLAGERLEFTTRMPYREGFTKYIHTDYIPDVQRGEVAGFYTLVIDQTEQVAAREQVQALNDKLTVLNEELTDSNTRLTRTNADLDTFVYTASHDLKSPITNIEGLLLALREVLPAEVQQGELVTQLLALLDDTVSRFRATITQLTDLVRLQQSQAGPAELVALQPLVDAVCHDLAPEIQAAGAMVHLDLPPGVAVSFAPANLRSIFYNLLSNAVKYRAPNRAAQVWVQAERAADGALVLAVRDNGLGLDATQQGRLFQVFQRLHTHVEGTGVGLYMIKRLIENGGATIAVHSEPGVGTTFTVTFRA